MIGTAGDSDCREVLKLLQNVHSEADFPNKETLSGTKTEFEGILVLPNKEVYSVTVTIISAEYDTWNSYIEQLPNKIACGHGTDFALTALDMGSNSVDAVKAAIKRSLYCGGPVQTMLLDDKPIIKNKKVKKINKDIVIEEQIVEK